MAELRWAESAVKDLEQIYTLEATAIFPYSDKTVPEMRNEIIREEILTSYRLMYRIQEESIEVIRIIHSAKDFKDIKK